DTVCLRANLVQNPGFEAFFFPQTSFIGAADPGSQFITGWKLPTRGTADFFNAQNNISSSVEVPANLCFGNQSARNGYGYAGIFAYTSSLSNYREYLENQLSAPLVPGKKYLVSLNVSLSEFSTVAIDNLGIALRATQTKELTFSNLAITPLVVSPDNQFLADKNNWVNISGIVTADQPYQYLIIGNFKNNASTDTLRVIDTSGVLSGGTFSGCASTTQGAYYFIDDVVVSEVNESAGAICRLSAVPLTLLSFTAKKQQEKSSLQWRTTNEQKTSHFEIQRSKEGGLFTSIGTINALNSPGEHNYSFDDNRPLTGINYYRLKQLDIDGKYEFSRVVSLQFEDVINVKIFPNPISNQVTIQLPASMTGGTLTIMAADGKIVHRSLVTTTEQKINSSVWANGVYMVQVKKDQKLTVQKLVKQ
ncbi:MAG: T9SS type A sorting domain-containing protein, partial [Chitinophagaceae bacterium]